MPTRNHGLPARTRFSEDENILLARQALSLLNWRWFTDLELVRRRDEQHHIPQLLFGIYLAAKQQKKISKTEACQLMSVDVATTGPKYIAALENEDLISIDNYPDVDKRKDFLTPTLRLARLVEKELARLGQNLTCLADHLQFLNIADGIDEVEARRVPSGQPSPSNLLPVDWPPNDIGTSFERWPKSKKR